MRRQLLPEEGSGGGAFKRALEPKEGWVASDGGGVANDPLYGRVVAEL